MSIGGEGSPLGRGEPWRFMTTLHSTQQQRCLRQALNLHLSPSDRSLTPCTNIWEPTYVGRLQWAKEEHFLKSRKGNVNLCYYSYHKKGMGVEKWQTSLANGLPTDLANNPHSPLVNPASERNAAIVAVVAKPTRSDFQMWTEPGRARHSGDETDGGVIPRGHRNPEGLL